MPLLPHAKKALRASLRKAQYNAVRRSKMRNAIKKFRHTVDENDLKEVFSTIDRALKQHLIHPNKAARLKSRLTKLLPKVVAKAPTKKAKKTITKKKVTKKVTAKKVKRVKKTQKTTKSTKKQTS